MLVVLGFVGLERLRGSKPSVQGESIAVLPLTNESGDAKEQYFSDGISEDLITALSEFPGLKVIGRSSSFQFRDSKEDSRSIGAKLQVAHLLEGSVRRSGDMVRVNAELINTADGSAQWSERYDRPYQDLFSLQDQVTKAVAAALRAKLLPGAQAAAQNERPPSGSLEAYNALLQGRFYFQRETEADCHKAIEYYTQATELDPQYALAWSGLSHAWTDLSGYYLGGARAHGRTRQMRRAVTRPAMRSPWGRTWRPRISPGVMSCRMLTSTGTARRPSSSGRWSWHPMTPRRSSISELSSRLSVRWSRHRTHAAGAGDGAIAG